MRFIKLVIISVFVLFFILTAISMLIPSTLVVSRSIDVQTDSDSVLVLVNNLSNWPKWLVNDDTSSVTVAATARPNVLTVNSTSIRMDRWDSVQVNTTWRTGKGREMKSAIYVLSKKNASYTSVQWQFIQQLKWYPWEKFSSIASEKVLGPYIEKNLERLKAVAEGSR